MLNYRPRWSCHVIATCDSPAQYVTYNMSVPSSTNMDVHTNHYLSMQCWHCIYWNVFPFLIIQLHAPIVYNWPDHQLKISILPDWQQHLLPNVPLGILPKNGYSTVYGMYVCLCHSRPTLPSFCLTWTCTAKQLTETLEYAGLCLRLLV